MLSSCRCCRWSGSWKQPWHALLTWRSGWPNSSSRRKAPTPARCRRRRARSPSVPSATSRPVKAVPVSGALEPNPDRVVDATLDACPHCAAVFPVEQQAPQRVYDRIELPPIRPDVTRVRRFGGRCACCGERATAQAPSGLEPGSPFGQSVVAWVIYLHYAHAIGPERLSALMSEMFALRVSEGALSNMLARAREPLLAGVAAIRDTVTASPVVCSDETSARVCRTTGGSGRSLPRSYGGGQRPVVG